MKKKTDHAFERAMDEGIIYDEAYCEAYPELSHAAVSEGADAKDIFNEIARELPPDHLGKQESLTEAQKLSKLGASSAKANQGAYK